MVDQLRFDSFLYLDFQCNFELFWFPFDTQFCYAEVCSSCTKIRLTPLYYMGFSVERVLSFQVSVPFILRSKIKILPGRAYTESDSGFNHELPEWRVMGNKLVMVGDHTIRLMIGLARLHTYYWAAVFVPSFCLVIAAEITLFIDEKHFEATIMVALTCTLVMYTLYSTVVSCTGEQEKSANKKQLADQAFIFAP